MCFYLQLVSTKTHCHVIVFNVTHIMFVWIIKTQGYYLYNYNVREKEFGNEIDYFVILKRKHSFINIF